MSQSTKKLLGTGKARDFQAGPGEVLIEAGGSVFAVSSDFFCRHCDGTGCKSCDWSGEEARRIAGKMKISGPYFVIGTNVYRHWPDSKDGQICDGEKQYGPDFVERYSTKKAAQRDADTMNKAWAEKAK